MKRSENFFEWVCEEEPAVVQNILNDAYVAMGLYKRLTEAAQAIVMQMLCHEDEALFTETAKRIFKANEPEVKIPIKLGLFLEKTKGWCINPKFKEGLRKGVESEGQFEPPKKKPRLGIANGDFIGSIDGVSHWSRILKLLLPTRTPEDESLRPLSKLPAQLLHEAGYLKDGELSMKGFQLLMSPTHMQVWALIRVYVKKALEAIKNTTQKNVSVKVKSQLIAMLFSLPFHASSVWYPCDERTRKTAQILAWLGVLYYSETNHKYQVTPLGKQMSLPEGTDTREKTGPQDGDIIVESNNRIYTYTSDPFKIEMMSLFAEIELRMTGMTTGRLTRESLQSAFSKNISAYQIVQYLEANSHPEMQNHLPTTVVDQIFSWESEMKRVTFAEGVLLTHPPPQLAKLHSIAISTSKSVDFDVLHSSEKYLVVSPAMHEKLEQVTKGPA
eukprot:TRINITY_DN11889_c0_g1_i3.p1 TRINITY_DN11889_c0_g1~~TRINITY_DN11889_c0_g1_i3.p1  ORF type:complete len:468 (+),score=76.69 TRINITY_DN11889_c0_g1_i3:77-1405(+)